MPKKSQSAKAHEALTNPWASAAAVVIAILWTIPTIGLLISSFRPQGDVQRSCWWTWFPDPNVTLENSVGRASCRASIGPYVLISVVAGYFKKTTTRYRTY